MFHSVLRFAPVPTPPSDALVTYELTRRFYREVNDRSARDRHYQWYIATAAQHQQELKRMQGDINLLGWFCRRKTH